MLKSTKNDIELLKRELNTKAGLSKLNAADCRALSYLITKQTGKRLSETTLKRIYGFTLTKFNPSLFTLDVLSQFCGAIDWDDFCNKHERETVRPAEQNIDWRSLQQSAGKITNFTIQTLKNRSGIPYDKTISRLAIDYHFTEFMMSDKPATLLSAPAGYGKTIALCHWVDDQIQQSVANGTPDIFLFFSCTSLMSALLTGRDINDWLLALLGHDAKKDVSVLFDQNRQSHAMFYLIIDGLDEHILKNDQFQLIIRQLMNVLSFHQSDKWFKLILTMRSSTWINYRLELDNGNDLWYTGFKDDNSCINMPLFSMPELNQLCTNLNPDERNSIKVDIADIFSYPLYLQYYYKQHQDDFSLNNVDSFCVYDLVSMFILNKIYMGQHSAEKILLIKGIVEKMNLGKDDFSVNKLLINGLIKQYQAAYHELVSIGFLIELNQSSNYSYNSHICFGNGNFLGHSIAKNLLLNNGDKFDSRLIKTINTSFADSSYKLPVLKWCIIHAIKTGQQDSFGLLTKANLMPMEKSHLLMFIRDMLEDASSSLKKNESLMQYFTQEFSEDMFNYFFGIELINQSYSKTLDTLLKFELSKPKKILVYTALAINATINLDLDKLGFLLEKLRSFSNAEYQGFAVNPLICLDCIYHYLQFNIVKKEALIGLTKLCFNPPEDKYNLRKCGSNDMLYLLGCYTMVVCDNPKKALRFTRLVGGFYRGDDNTVSSPYAFFEKILSGDFYFKMGNRDMVTTIFESVSEIRKENDDVVTPFMETLFYCLKLKTLVGSDRQDEIVREFKNLSSAVEESGSKLSKLYTLSMLMRQEDFLAIHPNFKKQVYYDYMKLVRENSLHSEGLFVNVGVNLRAD